MPHTTTHQHARRAARQTNAQLFILAHLRAEHIPTGRDPLRSRWPDVQTGISPTTGEPVVVIMPRPGESEKLGAHHWREGHKNLAKPILRTGRARTVKGG